MKRLVLAALLVANMGMQALTEITTSGQLQDALSGTQPTVIYVFADWCQVCDKSLVEGVEKDHPSVKFVSLNNDTIKGNQELKDLVKPYEITGLPTYLFVRSGKQHIKKTGGIPVVQLREHVLDFQNGKLKSDAELHAEWARLIKESPAPAAQQPAQAPVQTKPVVAQPAAPVVQPASQVAAAPVAPQIQVAQPVVSQQNNAIRRTTRRVPARQIAPAPVAGATCR